MVVEEETVGGGVAGEGVGSRVRFGGLRVDGVAKRKASATLESDWIGRRKGGMSSHEEDAPSLYRPFRVVELDQSAAFDEERDEDLHVSQDPLCRRVREGRRPYAK